jgi:hypothetical protein
MLKTSVQTFEQFIEEVLSLGGSDQVFLALNDDGSLVTNESNEVQIVSSAPDSLLFRGQTNIFPLIPKLGRNKDGIPVDKREISLIEELKRRGDKLAQSGKLNDWDLLVYAQHFGLATRLLDWTTNPLVALWFACLEEGSANNAYVFILKQTQDNILNLSKETSPFAIAHTKIFRPNLNNERIIAQNGWFTIHSLKKNENKFLPLHEEAGFTNEIWLVEIPAGLKATMMLKLSILGINNETIYPGIEGTCKHINWLNNI